jgi:hypothetical protein
VENVKKGAICTQATNCSADRELGDFQTITHNANGDALISFVKAPAAGESFVYLLSQTGGTTIQ